MIKKNYKTESVPQLGQDVWIVTLSFESNNTHPLKTMYDSVPIWGHFWHKQAYLLEYNKNSFFHTCIDVLQYFDLIKIYIIRFQFSHIQ